MTDKPLIIGVILAAGKGSRMHSNIPKVLCELEGKPLLEHVIGAMKGVPLAGYACIVSDQVAPFKEVFSRHEDVDVVIQHQVNGTASAVGAVSSLFKGVTAPSYCSSSIYRGLAACYHTNSYILVCAGDTPLLHTKLLQEFVAASLQASCDIAVLGAELADPMGYGRMVIDRNSKQLLAIVEERDTDETTKNIGEVNAGVLLLKSSIVFSLLSAIGNDNAQKEYYLTDIIALGNQQKMNIFAFITNTWENIIGINTPLELERAKQISLRQGISS